MGTARYIKFYEKYHMKNIKNETHDHYIAPFMHTSHEE